MLASVPSVKNAGTRESTFTGTAAPLRPLLVILICGRPVDTVEGTRKFICVLLTKLTGTAAPLMVRHPLATACQSKAKVSDGLSPAAATGGLPLEARRKKCP